MSKSTSVAVSNCSVDDPKKTTYHRVQSMFPGINIWLAPNCLLNCVSGEVNEARTCATNNGDGPPSVLKRVRDKCVRAVMIGTSRRAVTVHRPKVSPANAPEAGAMNFDFKLTEPERRYLEYLKKSIGEGQFSHYLMPARSFETAGRLD